MSRKTMSIRGEEVDFDLFEIKNQMSNSPKSDEVVRRERFIDKKRRRNSTRKINEMMNEQAENQRYARDMISAQRQAKDLISDNDAPALDEEALLPLQEPVTIEPQRLGRKINK